MCATFETCRVKWTINETIKYASDEKLLKRYKTDITALQKIRWKIQDCKKLHYNSSHAEKRIFGSGFVVGERLWNLV